MIDWILAWWHRWFVCEHRHVKPGDVEYDGTLHADCVDCGKHFRIPL